MRVENRGSTPAHNIRFAIFADVLPFPLRDDFPFVLPAADSLLSAIYLAPRPKKILKALFPDIPAPEKSKNRTNWTGLGNLKDQENFKNERPWKFGFF